MPQSNPTEQIRSAREDLIQGNPDGYFPTMQTDGQGVGRPPPPNRSDIPEGVRYLGQSDESTLNELGSQGYSPSSVYTPRPYDHLPNLVVREESVDSQVLLRPPFGSQSLATPDTHPKPILKQTFSSLLEEKRSSLHDILSSSPDQESRKPRRVSFADEDDFSPSAMPAGSEDSAPSVSEFEDSTTTKQFLRGITRMLFFELERRLKTNTPTPNNSRGPLPRSSSLGSIAEPEPSVDYVRVVPWDDRERHSGRGHGRSDSREQTKSQVFSWCDRHGNGSHDGGPKRMVELRTLPVDLQDWILEFERSRIEQTQGHGKGAHRIVHLDVSRVLNPS
jgi:hypothetical protein